VMDALDAFYRTTLPADAISFVKVPEAGHAMLSVADLQANAWRYTGENYHTRDGVQMRAVRAMIETLGMAPQPLQSTSSSTSGSTNR